MINRQDVLDWIDARLRGRPVGPSREELDRDRATIAKELEAIHAQRRKMLPPLEARLKTARDRFAARKAEADTAKRDFEAAVAADTGVRTSLDAREARLRHCLVDTADERIAAFVDELRDEFQLTRMQDPHLARVDSGRRDLETGRKIIVTESDHRAIVSRLAAIRSAIAAAEALRFEVSVDVEARIAEIRATIPAVAEVAR